MSNVLFVLRLLNNNHSNSSSSVSNKVHALGILVKIVERLILQPRVHRRLLHRSRLLDHRRLNRQKEGRRRPISLSRDHSRFLRRIYPVLRMRSSRMLFVSSSSSNSLLCRSRDRKCMGLRSIMCQRWLRVLVNSSRLICNSNSLLADLRYSRFRIHVIPARQRLRIHRLSL